MKHMPLEAQVLSAQPKKTLCTMTTERFVVKYIILKESVRDFGLSQSLGNLLAVVLYGFTSFTDTITVAN